MEWHNWGALLCNISRCRRVRVKVKCHWITIITTLHTRESLPLFISFLIGCNGVKRKEEKDFLFLKLSILAQSYNCSFILIDINIDKMATGGAWGRKATWKFYHLLLTGGTKKGKLSWIPDFVLLHWPNMPSLTHESLLTLAVGRAQETVTWRDTQMKWNQQQNSHRGRVESEVLGSQAGSDSGMTSRSTPLLCLLRRTEQLVGYKTQSFIQFQSSIFCRSRHLLFCLLLWE